MLNIILIFISFIIGFYVKPTYSVAFALFSIVLLFKQKSKIYKIDIIIFFYILILSFYYYQSGIPNALNEIILFILGPFVFYYFGKSSIKNIINFNRIILIIFYILFAYVLYLFFKNVDGEFSISLVENYYYNSRNNFIIKDNLNYVFVTETILSLLCLSCLILAFFLKINRAVKIILISILLLVLLILSSRTAIISLLIVLTYTYFKFEKVKFKPFRLLFVSFIIIVFFSNISVYDIPYINTFFNRVANLSFSEYSESYGLGGRFVYYLNALQHSDSLFDIKGYRNLLYKFEMSSHNEILGHTSSVGFIPAFTYFSIIFLLVKDGIRNTTVNNNELLKKIIVSLSICYLIIGLTENIFISNSVWIYLYMFFLEFLH